ncbi:hypothetical protein [Bradyrhizobium elkanii]|uniref:hypothetical protein n=1 Tax=Bradyrhizobium elkanii TaxID=29448 RepID=UPI000841D011|nr:hypothetical protein [Bradyrhizobium elkanii]ODM82239.1 hypothetical protein A6X20_17500 [Bradyrhizobium elkanii]ODM85347.1 hypothetical protein A6452_12070 [Bradyrhizobium elkanii]
METVVERVVRTYGMMVALAPNEEEEVRQRVLKFVEGQAGDNNTIAVEAIKFLRGPKLSRKRRPK